MSEPRYFPRLLREWETDTTHKNYALDMSRASYQVGSIMNECRVAVAEEGYLLRENEYVTCHRRPLRPDEWVIDLVAWEPDIGGQFRHHRLVHAGSKEDAMEHFREGMRVHAWDAIWNK